MKTIHDLIKAIRALEVDPCGGYVPALTIDAELVIKAHAMSYQPMSYQPMAMFFVEIGDRRHPKIYAEAYPITQPDWQESMLRDALTQIKTHYSILYIALGEPEIEPEPASPELPKNCRLLSLDEAREIQKSSNAWCIEGGLLGYRDASSYPCPVAGTEWVFFGDERFDGKATLLLISSEVSAELFGSPQGAPSQTSYAAGGVLSW